MNFDADTLCALRDVSAKSPMLTLNNGVAMPVLGLGVLDRSAREQTARAVQCAIANGYRLIDTAAAYGNERQVGEGLRGSGVDRSEMFITTKLWMTDYGCEPAFRAFDLSRRKLGLDYVDLYLLHWPMPSDFEAKWRHIGQRKNSSPTGRFARSACPISARRI